MEDLSKGLNLSIEEVEKYNYIGALNWLSFWQQRDEYIRSLNNKI